MTEDEEMTDEMQPAQQPETEGAVMIPEETVEERIRLAVEEACERERAASDGKIRELEETVALLRAEAARRDTEYRLAACLREHSLDETMASFLLSPGEGRVEDEVILARVNALERAVEDAAVREVRRRAVEVRPGNGSASPLTPRLIREMPVSRLAELMR